MVQTPILETRRYEGKLPPTSIIGPPPLVKNVKTYIYLKKNFLGNFQKSVTGSKSMYRSVMASSFQKWS